MGADDQGCWSREVIGNEEVEGHPDLFFGLDPPGFAGQAGLYAGSFDPLWSGWDRCETSKTKQFFEPVTRFGLPLPCFLQGSGVKAAGA